MAEIGVRHGIVFREYFAREPEALATFERDGSVKVESDRIVVLPPVRLLIRNIYMVFDHYLHERGDGRYSKVIQGCRQR